MESRGESFAMFWWNWVLLFHWLTEGPQLNLKLCCFKNITEREKSVTDSSTDITADCASEVEKFALVWFALWWNILRLLAEGISTR